MVNSIFIILLVSACLVAFRHWRWGVFAAIAIGLIQDPVRKMIPGAPNYMAMASVPVWLTVLASALFSQELKIRNFLDHFPRLGGKIILFACFLFIPALISASYGPGSWQITILGAMIYISALLALVAGWYFARDDAARLRVMAFYAIGASVMLIGGPLEVNGWGEHVAAIGTEALGHIWVTHRTGSAVYMMAGFFRGPDVMGWHATLVFMIAIIMALRTRGTTRYLWILVAVWGILNVWLCGRRKMLSMIPVFLGCYLFLIFKYKDTRKFLPAIGLLIMTVGIGWYTISSLFLKTEVQEYYLTTLHEADDQIKHHGFDSVLVTIKQAGFWGYGLGMGQQGTHHLKVAKPRIWQESGPTKIVAELGVPGAILFFVLISTLIMTLIQVVRYSAPYPSFEVSAGLLAILAANLTSAMVSGQIYGDPFVAVLLSLITGMLLAGARFIYQDGSRK